MGLLESFPEGLVGEWVVDEESYTATDATEFDQMAGDFEVGVCVLVTYEETDEGNIASYISTIEGNLEDDCEDNDDDDDGDGDGEHDHTLGLIESFPEGLVGQWVIDGEAYSASEETEFDQMAGDFEVGVCVFVLYEESDEGNLARYIATTEWGCDDNPWPGMNKVYATIDSFPASPYVGAWSIGGMAYEGTEETEFDQDHGDFAVGACVEAKYEIDDDANILLEVETEHDYKCKEGDGNLFTTYGVAEVLPNSTDWRGIWRVGGVVYQADAGTSFEQTHGDFAVGAYIEVKYNAASGMENAVSIKTHMAPDNAPDSHMGILEAHDSRDDWNEWVIDGVTYMADPAIEVGSDNRAPEVGDTVVINSYQMDGNRYLTAVKAAHELFIPAVRR